MSGTIRERKRCVLEELKNVQTKLNRTTSLKHIETQKPKCVYRSIGDISSQKPFGVISSQKFVDLTDNTHNDDSSSVSSLSSDSGFHVATPPPSSTVITPEGDEQYHVTPVGIGNDTAVFHKIDGTADYISSDTKRNSVSGTFYHISDGQHEDKNNGLETPVLEQNRQQHASASFISTFNTDNITKRKAPPRQVNSRSSADITPLTRRQSEPTQKTSLFRNRGILNIPLRQPNTTKQSDDLTKGKVKSKTVTNLASAVHSNVVLTKNPDLEKCSAHINIAQENSASESEKKRQDVTSPSFISTYKSESNLLLSGQLRRSSLKPEKFVFDLSQPGRSKKNNEANGRGSENVISKRWSVSSYQPQQNIYPTSRSPLKYSPVRSISESGICETKSEKKDEVSHVLSRKRTLPSSFSSSNLSLFTPPPPLPLPPSSPSLSPVSPGRYTSTCQFTFGNKRSRSEPQFNSFVKPSRVVNEENSHVKRDPSRKTSGIVLNSEKTEVDAVTEPEIVSEQVKRNLSIPALNISSSQSLSSSSDSSDSDSEQEGYDTTDSITFDSYDVTGSYEDAPESGRSEQLLDNGESACILYTIQKVGDSVKTVRQKIRPGTVADMRKLFSKKQKPKKKRKVGYRGRIVSDSNKSNTQKCEETRKSSPRLLTYEKIGSVSRLRVPEVRHGLYTEHTDNVNSKHDRVGNDTDDSDSIDADTKTVIAPIVDNSETYTPENNSVSIGDRLLPDTVDTDTVTSYDTNNINFKKKAENVLEEWYKLHSKKINKPVDNSTDHRADHPTVNRISDNFTDCSQPTVTVNRISDNSTDCSQPTVTINRISDISTDCNQPTVTVNRISDISTGCNQPTVTVNRISDISTDCNQPTVTVNRISDISTNCIQPNVTVNSISDISTDCNQPSVTVNRIDDISIDCNQPTVTVNRNSDISTDCNRPTGFVNVISDVSTDCNQPTLSVHAKCDISVDSDRRPMTENRWSVNSRDCDSNQRTMKAADDTYNDNIEAGEKNSDAVSNDGSIDHTEDTCDDIKDKNIENLSSDSDSDNNVIRVQAGRLDVTYQTKTSQEKVELPTFTDNLVPSRRSCLDDGDLHRNNKRLKDQRFYHSCENISSKVFSLPRPEYGRKSPIRGKVDTLYANDTDAFVYANNLKCNTLTKSRDFPLSGQNGNIIGGDIKLMYDREENSTSRQRTNESHSRSLETDDSGIHTHMKVDKINSYGPQRGGKYVSKIKVLPVAENVRRIGEVNSINKALVRSSVSFDTPGADDTSSQARLTVGEHDEMNHVTSETSGADPAQVIKRFCILTKTDVPCTTENSDTLEYRDRKSKVSDSVFRKEHNKNSKMPEKSSGNSSFRETSEFRDGQQITTKYLSASNTNGDVEVDLNANNTDDPNEQTIALLKQAMVKYNGENSEDILPIINQTVTKLEGGGNLVLTTLTRKVVEEEDEAESSRVPDSPTRVNDSVYYVEDHKGNVYMVEDITDETRESAYYSSSERHASDSHNTSHDGEYNGIFNLRSVGQTGIERSTAEEVLLGIYNPGNTGSTLTIEELDEYNRCQQYDNQRALTTYVRPQNNNQYGYTTDNSSSKETSSYMYEIPGNTKQTSHPYSSSTVKTVKQSYEMTSGNPWGNDADSVTSASGGVADDEIKMQRQETIATTNIDSSGCNAMLSSYMYQTDATLMTQPTQVIPYTISPPLLQLPPPPKLVQLDLTPVQNLQLTTTTPIMSTKVTETKKIVTEPEVKEPPLQLSEPGRPVYKSVALVKGPYETPKWENINEETKKYKIINSHASDEIQEKTMTFDESKSMYKVARSENYGESVKQMKQEMFDENRNWSMREQPQHTYRSEKVIHVNGAAPRDIHKTVVGVSAPQTFVNSSAQQNHDDMMTTLEITENNKTTTTQKFSSETTMPPLEHIPPPNMIDLPSVQRDMRVVRGNILIKNTMEQGLDEFNDNINLFHNGFSMSKQNPLYQSDEDIHKRVQTETNTRGRHQDQDLTYETVDRYTKTKEVKRDKPRSRHQNLSQLLLSRLSTIDAKDIRQHIDVKHNSEDIYGDVRFEHADGSQTGSGNTNNFDSVGENIDLVMKDGKAFITITVTAERYTPIDFEFNVWRKSQAIVTRVIEIDFLANEQRRRLYYHVMEKAGTDEERGLVGHRTRPLETVLSSKETLDLFSEIMDATDGEGDHEDVTVKTRQHRTTLPPSHQDFLY